MSLLNGRFLYAFLCLKLRFVNFHLLFSLRSIPFPFSLSPTKHLKDDECPLFSFHKSASFTWRQKTFASELSPLQFSLLTNSSSQRRNKWCIHSEWTLLSMLLGKRILFVPPSFHPLSPPLFLSSHNQAIVISRLARKQCTVKNANSISFMRHWEQKNHQ